MELQIFPGENATERIQQAIDKLFALGGGRVVLCDGEYFIRSLLLRSNVTLYLKAGVLVKGSRNPEDYDLSHLLQPQNGEDYSGKGACPIAASGRNWIKTSLSTDPFSRWSRAMIKAYRAKNIAVIGEAGATFDGQNCFDELGEEGFRGPHFINLHECDGVLLQGYTLQNSSNWGHAMFTSCNITCRDLTVLAGHDGVDFLSCDNVIVQGCTFRSGDDCLAGFDCSNVLIEDCLLSTACNALRIGGEVTVRRCRILGSGEFGHRGTLSPEEKRAGVVATAGNARCNMESAFEYYSDFRYAIRMRSNVVIEDCEVENCDKLLSYGFTLPKKRWCKNEPLHTLKLRGVRAKGVGLGCYLYAPEEHPLSLEIRDCEISVKGQSLGIAAHTALSLENVRLSGEGEVYLEALEGTAVQLGSSDKLAIRHAQE